MGTLEPNLDIDLRPGELIELLVADLSLARAFFSGTPTARLLARLRLASDEADLGASQAPVQAGPSHSPPPGSSPPRPTASTWDQRMARLLGEAGEATADRIKRAIARHARAAADEGPLAAPEPVVAAFVLALAGAPDTDASPAEAFASSAEIPPALELACAAYDPRLLSDDRRAPLFEACVRLATLASAGPWPSEQVVGAASRLRASELEIDVLRASSSALLPLDSGGGEPPAPAAERWTGVAAARATRRMTLLERGEIDALLARDPRELAPAVARVERRPTNGPVPVQTGGVLQGLYVDHFLADLARLLSRRGALVLATIDPMVPAEELAPSELPPDRPISWMPSSWTTVDAAAVLADALERGATTLPRARGVIARGGDPALDAIGAEMLHVAAHPFASAAFAEVLARTGRPRDIVRLVTYFAIAPDPVRAAAALGLCTSPELPGVLNAWMVSILPSDGALAPPGHDPDTSSAARLSAWVSALQPYPHLYGAVRPLLARVHETPTAPND